VPADAQVEINAKVFAGYEGGDTYKVDLKKLKATTGRDDMGGMTSANKAE
jgi:hypothetical protein